MPPGLGDAILDVIRLVKRMEFLSVTTGSKLAIEVVKNELAMLKELGIPVVGVIENMKAGSKTVVEQEVTSMGISFLGSIDFDAGFEEALGDPDRLEKTGFFGQLGNIADRALTKGSGKRR
jgi:ATP-binding protein involved in chromosome partitioning